MKILKTASVGFNFTDSYIKRVYHHNDLVKTLAFAGTNEPKECLKS